MSWRIGTLAVVLVSLAAQANDQWEGTHLQLMHEMCTWSKANAPEGNPVEMRVCAIGAEVPVVEMEIDFNAWWRHWQETDPALADQLSKKWQSNVDQRFREAEEKADEAKRIAAQKRRAAQLAALPTMSIEELCKIVRGPTPNEAHAELVKRRAFTPTDLELIATKSLKLGMDEEAMLCSLGPPKRANRSVGSWGVHIQHVYAGGNVYTENGKVTSWQD
jgi:hypothetical protein